VRHRDSHYPDGNAIPDAYFRKGLALADMRDVNGARTAWETVVRISRHATPAGSPSSASIRSAD
jgi:hypothetical protein